MLAVNTSSGVFELARIRLLSERSEVEAEVNCKAARAATT